MGKGTLIFTSSYFCIPVTHYIFIFPTYVQSIFISTKMNVVHIGED